MYRTKLWANGCLLGCSSLKGTVPEGGVAAFFQRQVVDEVARLFEVDVLFLTVVFKDAERPVGTDFAAGKVDVFAGFGIAENDAG